MQGRQVEKNGLMLSFNENSRRCMHLVLVIARRRCRRCRQESKYSSGAIGTTVTMSVVSVTASAGTQHLWFP